MYISYILIAVLLVLIFMFFRRNLKAIKNMPQVAESDKIINLNDKNFKSTTTNNLALIDFWAEWCMPCRMMTPILNEVADESEGKVKICKINVDQERNLASKFSVRSIPTLILLKNGQVVDRFVGVKQKDFLLKQIQKHNIN